MNRYPTDEELNALIEELEAQELYAPRNLKEQILNRLPVVQSDTNAEDNVVTETTGTEKDGIHRPVSFLSYSAKVIAGMAAAVTMLILFPMQGSQAKETDRIAWEERQNREVYERWETKLQKQKAREEAWEKGTEEVQQKIENILSGFDSLWNREMEDN